MDCVVNIIASVFNLLVTVLCLYYVRDHPYNQEILTEVFGVNVQAISNLF